ncbi:MAG: hypothetical protein AB7V57_20740 [Verrucomicrobiales bacterium]
MKNVFTSLALVGLLVASQSHAQDVSALASKVADALGYPASKLTATDESARYAEKTKSQAIAVFNIQSSDQTFAPVSIAVGRQGALLKPEIEADCQAKIKEGSTTIKRFEIKGGIHGYSGLGIAGPGGSEERLLAVWPERGVDLQIKITTPREGVEFADSTKAYHELVMNGGPLLAEKLVKCMENLAEHVEKADIRGTATAQQTEPSPASLPQSPQSTQSKSSKATSSASQPTAATPSKEPTSSTPWSIIVVLTVAAISLLWLLLKRRS